MDLTAFVYGFLTALVFVFILLSAVYVYLKRLRVNKADMKGYLDLIPDLSEPQKAQLQEIRRVFLPKVEGIRQDMRRNRAELAELLFDEPAERDKIYAVSGEILGHQAALEHEVIEHILEEKEFLTASQKRKFYEIIVEQFSTGGLGVHDVKTDKNSDAASKKIRGKGAIS